MGKPKPRPRGHTRSCGTKQKFDTEEEATKAAKRGRWDYMSAYRCRKCKKFHYGHPPSR